MSNDGQSENRLERKGAAPSRVYEIEVADGVRSPSPSFFCAGCGWAGHDCICSNDAGVARRELGIAHEKRKEDLLRAAEILAGHFETAALVARTMTAAAEAALASFLAFADALRSLPPGARLDEADPPIEEGNGP